MAGTDTQKPAEVDPDTLDRLEEQSEPAVAKGRKAPRRAAPAPSPDRKG